MKIHSSRADKNVDCIRTSMRTEKHNSLHVTLNFRRIVGGPVAMEEETGSEVIINFTDTCELENFIMALTQLKEMTKGYYGKWEIEKENDYDNSTAGSTRLFRKHRKDDHGK